MTIMEAKTDAHSTQPTTHPPYRRFVVFRHHYVRACNIRASSLNVRAFGSCRDVAYTAIRDKDRTIHVHI